MVVWPHLIIGRLGKCPERGSQIPGCEGELLAVGFQPPAAKSRVNFTILVNKQPVNFTDPIKNGDELAVVISEHDSSKPFMDSGTAAESTAANAAVNLTGANEKRTMTPEAIRDSIRLADKINSIPGLSDALRNNRF